MDALMTASYRELEDAIREAFLTLPGVRVLLIDDLRNGGDENKSHGVNELRLRKESTSSRRRWLSMWETFAVHRGP